jgi:hypothetical protein
MCDRHRARYYSVSIIDVSNVNSQNVENVNVATCVISFGSAQNVVVYDERFFRSSKIRLANAKRCTALIICQLSSCCIMHASISICTHLTLANQMNAKYKKKHYKYK